VRGGRLARRTMGAVAALAILPALGAAPVDAAPKFTAPYDSTYENPAARTSCDSRMTCTREGAASAEVGAMRAKALVATTSDCALAPALLPCGRGEVVEAWGVRSEASEQSNATSLAVDIRVHIDQAATTVMTGADRAGSGIWVTASTPDCRCGEYQWLEITSNQWSSGAPTSIAGADYTLHLLVKDQNTVPQPLHHLIVSVELQAAAVGDGRAESTIEGSVTSIKVSRAP
jgi:hypothetical protein